MTEALFTYTIPIFEVEGEVKDELAADILRLEIEETTAGLKTLSLRLLGLDKTGLQQPYLDGSIIDFGKKLSVVIGAAPAAYTVFTGRISAIEAIFREGGESEVVIFAEDELMKLRMTRRMKTYENVSDADIAAAIAGEHGLTPEVDADGPVYDLVQQWNQSDLAFLRERARRIQAEIWAEDGSLHLATRDRRRGTSVTMTRGSDLITVSAKADLAEQCTTVRVSGYDAAARASIDAEAPASTVEAE